MSKTETAAIVIGCVVFLFCLYLYVESREEDDTGKLRFNPHRLGFVLQKTFSCCPTRCLKKSAKCCIACGLVGTSCLEYVNAPEIDEETGRKMKYKKKRLKKSSKQQSDGPNFHPIASSDDEDCRSEGDLEAPAINPITASAPVPVQPTALRIPAPAPRATPPIVSSPVNQAPPLSRNIPSRDASALRHTRASTRTQRMSSSRGSSRNGQSNRDPLHESGGDISPLTIGDRNDDESVVSDHSDTRIDLSSHSGIKSNMILPASADLKNMIASEDRLLVRPSR